MITIDVGAEHAKYSVYAELISYYSGYFKGTLNGPWKEAEDRVIELPDIEPRVFDVFIDWLYTQKLPKRSREWVTPTAEIEAGSHNHSRVVERLMMEVYVFADRFLVPQLKAALFRFFANFCNNDGIPPYYEAIIYAFDNLPSTSPMLNLLVKLHCAYWTESSDTSDNGELELRHELPHDFFLRGMAQFAKGRDKEKAKGIACCECHKETTATEREGCETCNPLPEVKEETPAENSAPTDAAATNDNAQTDQTNATPADNDQANNDQTNNDQTTNDQANQDNAAPAVDGGQNNDNTDQTPPANDAGQPDQTEDQASGSAQPGQPEEQSNEAAVLSSQGDEQTPENNPARQDIGGDVPPAPPSEITNLVETIAAPIEQNTESAEVSVPEGEASSSNNPNGDQEPAISTTTVVLNNEAR